MQHGLHAHIQHYYKDNPTCDNQQLRMVIFSHNFLIPGSQQQGAQDNGQNQSVQGTYYYQHGNRPSNKGKHKGRYQDKRNNQVAMVFFQSRAEGPDKGNGGVGTAHYRSNGS